MPQFDAVIGAGRKPVTVEYEFDEFGVFKVFHVVACFLEPEDIAPYLSTYEIDFLQFQCQMYHRGESMKRNEAVISRTANRRFDDAFDTLE